MGAVVVQGVEEVAGLLGCKQAPVVAGCWFWSRILHTFLFFALASWVWYRVLFSPLSEGRTGLYLAFL